MIDAARDEGLHPVGQIGEGVDALSLPKPAGPLFEGPAFVLIGAEGRGLKRKTQELADERQVRGRDVLRAEPV